jgi:hypothetical protein
VLKLFGFPRDNTGEFGVHLSSLDKVLANKTIERLDELVAKDVTVSCNSQLQQSLAQKLPVASAFS